MLREGDTLQVPVLKGSRPEDIRVHALVVDHVRQADGESLYCFRDAHGPAVCIREARLMRLRLRLGADVAAALDGAPAPS